MLQGEFINNWVSLTKGEPMSFYDGLAQKAILDGNTSAEFKSAAKKHANWTYVLAILTGVVWYFSGRIWVLIFGALTLLSATRSISANMVKRRIEKLEKSRSFGP
jgi:hypothetical protein